MQETKDRSLTELFSDLVHETRTLVQQEIQLAKTEMSEKATRVGKDISSVMVGGAIAYAGFLALMLAAIIGLANFIPDWLSALIVGVVLAGVGLVIAQQARSDLKRESVTPHRTVETLQEDKQWAKERMK